MLKVTTEILSVETDIENGVRCPSCGRLLVDIRFVKKGFMVRTKCPKCKSYIDIKVAGEKED